MLLDFLNCDKSFPVLLGQISTLNNILPLFVQCNVYAAAFAVLYIV